MDNLKAGSQVVVVEMPDGVEAKTFIKWMSMIQPNYKTEPATFNGFGVFVFGGAVVADEKPLFDGHPYSIVIQPSSITASADTLDGALCAAQTLWEDDTDVGRQPTAVTIGFAEPTPVIGKHVPH